MFSFHPPAWWLFQPHRQVLLLSHCAMTLNGYTFNPLNDIFLSSLSLSLGSTPVSNHHLPRIFPLLSVMVSAVTQKKLPTWREVIGDSVLIEFKLKFAVNFSYGKSLKRAEKNSPPSPTPFMDGVSRTKARKHWLCSFSKRRGVHRRLIIISNNPLDLMWLRPKAASNRFTLKQFHCPTSAFSFFIFSDVFDVISEGQQFEHLGFSLSPVVRTAIMRKVSTILARKTAFF